VKGNCGGGGTAFVSPAHPTEGAISGRASAGWVTAVSGAILGFWVLGNVARKKPKNGVTAKQNTLV